MNPKVLSVIAVILVVVGTWFFWSGRQSPSFGLPSANDVKLEQVSTPAVVDETIPTETEVPLENVQINNFDECVAAGNKPFVDAPDKCLTKDGHVFIQGVVE